MNTFKKFRLISKKSYWELVRWVELGLRPKWPVLRNFKVETPPLTRWKIFNMIYIHIYMYIYYIYILYIIYIILYLSKKLRKSRERFWLQGAKCQSQSPLNSASEDRILRLNFCSLTKIFSKCCIMLLLVIIYIYIIYNIYIYNIYIYIYIYIYIVLRGVKFWENPISGGFFWGFIGCLTPMITLYHGYLDLFCSPRVVWHITNQQKFAVISNKKL